MQKKLKTVAVGGTFDELHKGHRALLVKAFEVGEHVLVGLCSDEFVRKMNKEHKIASYDHRSEDLKTFLRKNDLLKRAEILPLNDSYGVTLSKSYIEGLIVSKETEPMAIKINEKRKAMGLTPLQTVVIEMIPSENHTPISSTRIHRGEMDREGHLMR